MNLLISRVTNVLALVLWAAYGSTLEISGSDTTMVSVTRLLRPSVTWALMDENFEFKLISLFTHGIIGQDQEKCLATLKKIIKHASNIVGLSHKYFKGDDDPASHRFHHHAPYIKLVDQLSN